MESVVSTTSQAVIRDSPVRLVRGDITELEVDAFVFYAQPDLALGSGFGGAIAVRGGASVQKELNSLAEAGLIPTGEAVVTGSGNLRSKYVIHAVGPRFKETRTEEKLHATMLSCLRRAAEIGARSLAFPLMGSGYYGIPAAVSARVMLQALEDHLDLAPRLEEITVCVFDTSQVLAFEAALAARNQPEEAGDA